MQSYQFKTIDAEGAEVLFACFEGDNEGAIIDAGSNGSSCYLVLVINHGADEPFALVREEYPDFIDAMHRMTEFLIAEYEAGL